MNVDNFKNLYIKMYEAMIKKDIKTLSDMHENDFVLVHMTGVRQNKKEYLKAVQDGTLNYYSFDSVEVIPINDYSFIGRCRVLAAVYGGSKHTWNLQFDIELSNDNKFKKITASTY